VNNEKNLGIVETLNKGIGLAKGEYIARMDCDDISLPERLEKQVKVLDENPAVALVATQFEMMDGHDLELGIWPSGIKIKTPAEIRRRMPAENCIAHPAAMGRKKILENYPYRKTQQGAEDWDLWLNLLSEGFIISKVDEVLLRYRVHEESVTLKRNKRSPYINKGRTLWKYVLYRITALRFNLYDVRVLIYAKINYLKHLLFLIHSRLPVFAEKIFKTNPLSIAGILFKVTFWFGKDAGLFLFISDKADKVNCDKLIRLAYERHGVIISTGAGKGSGYVKLGGIPQVPYLSNYIKRRISKIINRADKPLVIGYNDSFFYNLLVYLQPQATTVDICRRLSNYEEANTDMVYDYSLWCAPLAGRITKRVLINGLAEEELKKAYSFRGIDETLLQRICRVNNTDELIKSIFE
jgi:glycosyltransferase involved in cell wall biosynthesis